MSGDDWVAAIAVVPHPLRANGARERQTTAKGLGKGKAADEEARTNTQLILCQSARGKQTTARTNGAQERRTARGRQATAGAHAVAWS